MKTTLLLLLTCFAFSCTKYKNVPEYDIIENKQYDAPVKSQISLRVALQDSTATDEQIKELITLLANSSMQVSMKKHPKPTHVFVYVYRSKYAYEAFEGNWIAMYQKIGADDSGKYEYRPADYENITIK